MIKVGRNKKCPCGSDKKYKFCCEGKEKKNSKLCDKCNRSYSSDECPICKDIQESIDAVELGLDTQTKLENKIAKKYGKDSSIVLKTASKKVIKEDGQMNTAFSLCTICKKMISKKKDHYQTFMVKDTIRYMCHRCFVNYNRMCVEDLSI